MKTCASCEQVKPAEAFSRQASAPDGLRSRCRDCTALERETWNRLNPQHRDMDRSLRGTDPDPMAYSFAVCRHVALFLERAIGRFEGKTGKEAPPHLQALLSIATDTAAQVELKFELVWRRCEECESWFKVRKRVDEAVTQKFCSAKCRHRVKSRRQYAATATQREEAARERLEMSDARRRHKETMVTARRLIRQLPQDVALLLRLEGHRWKNVCVATGYASEGAAYLAADAAASRRGYRLK